MPSVLNSENRSWWMKSLLHFTVWAAFLCLICDVSDATSSLSHKTRHRSPFRHSFFHDLPSHSNHLDDHHTTHHLQGNLHEIPNSHVDKIFLDTDSRKNKLHHEGSSEIKAAKAPLKLIHRTSIVFWNQNTPADQSGLILRQMLELDAVRLKGYSFSSSSHRKSPAKALSPSERSSAAAGDGVTRAAEKSFQTANNRISSGAALGSGQYFVDFYLGTPAKKFLLIADTGSDLIWLQCHPCRKCFPQSNPLYDPHTSSSFSSVACSSDQCFLVPAPPQGGFCNSRAPTSCQYTYLYNDQSSTTGFLASETITMMSSSGGFLKINNITFGCGLENKGQSFFGSNGVLGLGQGGISFASQLGHLYSSKFSYCLVNYLKPTAESSLLVFGDAQIEENLKNSIQYTPLLRNSFAKTYYYVGIKKICVNEQFLDISSQSWEIDSAGYGGTIIDSGTTLTYFRESAYLVIVSAFQRAITAPRVAPIQGLDLCFNFSADSGKTTIPEFSILLEGDALFRPPPGNYFIDTAPGVKCLAMQGVSSSLGSNTIGNLLQQNFHVEYDRSNARLGFVWTNCSSSF